MKNKQRFFTLLLSAALLLSGGCTSKSTKELPRSKSPEAQGISSQGILHFLDAVEQSGMELHSFMILRHGEVVAEGWWSPFTPDQNHTMFSVSKTFTATAIGFAVREGVISVEDQVISFFPDQLPDSISDNLKELKVKHLLTMSAGQENEPTVRGDSTKTDWVKGYLETPIVEQPGSKFRYSSMASHMLSAIIQKVSGQNLIEYLTPRLFEPLHINGITCSVDPMGISHGGWGFEVKSEDMAKLGQFFLQKGQWNGKQLLPETWIAEATTAKIIQDPTLPQEQSDLSDWNQGYCYQMWRSRNNAYRADGAQGQYIIIMPEQDAVVVITAKLDDMQAEINLVWDYLLPAMQANTLPEDPQTLTILQNRLSGLKIHSVQ